FFLDSSKGWMIVSHYDDAADTRDFSVAATNDAGTNWLFSKVVIPGLNAQQPAHLTNNVSLVFADAMHGFVTLGTASSPVTHGAVGAYTSDGGTTWKMTAGVTKGPMLFTTQNSGWVLSPEADQLLVTHDGTVNWQEVAPVPPAQI